MKTVNIIDGQRYTNEEAHRLLWNWLAENPSMSKRDFFDSHLVNILPIGKCYACVEVLDRKLGCGSCPINWSNVEGAKCKHCGDFNSLYTTWRITNDLEIKALIAREIANMEWKEQRGQINDE